MVFKENFELSREVGKGFHGDGGSSEGSLPESSCPGKDGSFSHIGEGKGDFLSISVIDFLIYCKVESD